MGRGRGGGWKIFTRNGGKPGMGGGFIMGGWEIFSLIT